MTVADGLMTLRAPGVGFVVTSDHALRVCGCRRCAVRIVAAKLLLHVDVASIMRHLICRRFNSNTPVNASCSPISTYHGLGMALPIVGTSSPKTSPRRFAEIESHGATVYVALEVLEVDMFEARFGGK